ncbi:hypothetical protein EHV15_26500 [Paenibacillus oralis]|uniref:Uncharacterized protein n=1 Tax=Paenibacillus oralis TaxID=2490856 RepID=A0A3P3U931_9BACL|nr:hypothetical protein [Paenibacillus oralis]RRJ66069.1 hypothetical protein EHV15_26500 [Paenibacillus oralis]
MNIRTYRKSEQRKKLLKGCDELGGTMWLFISKDLRVTKITKPINQVYKPIPSLARQEVLKVTMYYETKSRKPFKLQIVNFDRFILDENGGFVITDFERRRALHNFFEFGMTTPEEKAEDDQPIALPIPPVIPTIKEKEALYSYLKQKYSVIADQAPIIVENMISFSNETHRKHIEFAKKAMKIRNKLTSS